jgi:hypothetical protein
MDVGASGQDEQYATAAATFGAAIERLARAYEADADVRRDLIQEGPMLAGLAVLTVGLHLARPGSSLMRVLPIAVLAALWVAGAWWTQRRHAKRLQQQIEEVDATSHR